MKALKSVGIKIMKLHKNMSDQVLSCGIAEGPEGPPV